MKNNYIRNGRISRTKIALDIKYRKLNRDGIEELVKDSKIQESYVNNNYDYKKPKSDWDEDYVDWLSRLAINVSFNRDYLLYLDTVSNHVYEKKRKRRNVYYLMIVIIIAIFITFIIYLKIKK
jgi:hypothetical protein